MRRATAADPDDRFADVDALADAVRAALAEVTPEWTEPALAVA